MCFWCCFGLTLYVKEKEGLFVLDIKNKLYFIESLTFFDLFLFIIQFIVTLLIDYLALNVLNDYITVKIYELTNNNNMSSNQNDNTNSQALNKISDVANAAYYSAIIASSVKKKKLSN